MPSPPKTNASKKSAAGTKPKARERLVPQDIFWADQLAEQIAERINNAGKSEATCKAGASPSGAKHIGNLFDVMKAHIVFKALQKAKVPSRFILTHDDRDPLRTIPSKLPDREGVLVDTSQFKEGFVKYIGHPYHTIPDPFDCCHSWAEHFSHVWELGILGCGISENDIEFVSNDYLYRKGKFDPWITKVLENIDTVRKVFAPFQESMRPDYVPLNAICGKCGKITARIIGWNIDDKTLNYACEEKMLTSKYAVKGCGHHGTVPWSEAKLTWRFEWPAQWAIFSNDFEAFGKEHAEGSWPSGKAIAENVYGIQPPIPHIYEFLMIDGKKMAARFGNVYIAHDILGIMEPEVFAYFYTKRSKKQRNLDIKTIYHLVDDFEHVERIYWGIDKETNDDDRITAMREYESAMPAIPKKMPLRIEYQFAAMISQLAQDTEHAVKMLRASGHIKQSEHIGPEEMTQIARRLSLAKTWVHKYVPELAVKINDTVPKDVLSALSFNQREALHALADVLGRDIDQEKLYNAFYEISKANNLKPAEFFRAAYQVLMNKSAGPRLAPFILALGRLRTKAIFDQTLKY